MACKQIKKNVAEVTKILKKARFYIEPMIFTLTCINIIACGVFFVGYVWPKLQGKIKQVPEWLSLFDSLGQSLFNVPVFPLIIITMMYNNIRQTGRGCLLVLWLITIPNELYRFTYRPIDWYFAVMLLIVFTIFAYITIKHILINR